jgi:pimeloyl-ACP methyl ester carboxylesterase
VYDSVMTAALQRLGRTVIDHLDDDLDDRSAAQSRVEHGRRGAVVLVGGFATTDPVLAPMGRWLTADGWEVTATTEGAGMGCARLSVDALRTRTIAAAERAQSPVWLIGHSRGGQFARAVAGEVPDHVAGLITLGAPFDLYGLGLPVMAAAAVVTAAGSLGVPGMATLRCLTGSCCRDFRATLRRALPPGMPFTSIYSHGDRTVPARASIDPGARNVEVAGGHLSLLTSACARRAVATALDASTVIVDHPQNRPVSA